MLFNGPPGSGKTSVAECVARSLFGKSWKRYYIEFNASDERGIDMVRQRIIPLLQVKGRRIVFLDEADRLTPEAQDALRRPSEKTRSTKIIFAANYEWKIIDAIKSRCAIFRFKRLKDDVVLRRLLEICKAEKITINKDAKEGFLELVKFAGGDLRKAINTLEKLIDEKKEISAKSVIELKTPQLAVDALNIAINGDFERAKEMIEDAYINSGFMWQEIIDELYNGISELKDPYIKKRLFIKLAETEGFCRQGGSPIIQLVAFISYANVAPHLPKGCPATKEMR